MRKPLTNIPQTKAHTSERENQETVCKTRKLVKGPDMAKKPVKSRLHNWWRIRALGFHQETTEESGKQQDRFCIKLCIIFYEIKFVILFCSRTVIRTKTLFFNTSEILQISVVKFKIQNTIFQHMKLLQNFSYKFKIQNYRRYLNVSRNIIT